MGKGRQALQPGGVSLASPHPSPSLKGHLQTPRWAVDPGVEHSEPSAVRLPSPPMVADQPGAAEKGELAPGTRMR